MEEELNSIIIKDNDYRIIGEVYEIVKTENSLAAGN